MARVVQIETVFKISIPRPPNGFGFNFDRLHFRGFVRIPVNLQKIFGRFFRDSERVCQGNPVMPSDFLPAFRGSFVTNVVIFGKPAVTAKAQAILDAKAGRRVFGRRTHARANRRYQLLLGVFIVQEKIVGIGFLKRENGLGRDF
ncbi:MAG: hypothetical protein ACLFRG_08935 [Desulfococcaceae bacterium]